MRPGQNKRMRGRPNNAGGGHRKGPNPLTRSYESNGPDVKIRGNAHHVAEKYLQLARDAQSSGDPVAAESYLQHAEHYFRLIASAQAAQAGYGRLPDAVDTEGEDDDDSGIPDRFASPQAPAPFVPPQAPQPYAAERQPYNGQGGERQPYADRQGTNGERPSYNDRSQRQDRPFQNGQGQDRNGQRRPYRDNAGGEIRTDDRGDRQDRNPDRPYADRPFQDRQNQAPQGQNGQEFRPDRQSRRERFAQERLERQERQAQERAGQGGYERPQGYRDQQPEAPRDAYAEEQPRFHDERPVEVESRAAPEPRQDARNGEARQEPAPMPEDAPQPVLRSEPVLRAEPPLRREPRTPAPSVDDAPGLPSFITTPTRVAAPEPAAAEQPVEPALTTAFPGDGAEEAPKFPRRRRRTTRAAEAGEPAGD